MYMYMYVYMYKPGLHQSCPLFPCVYVYVCVNIYVSRGTAQMSANIKKQLVKQH